MAYTSVQLEAAIYSNSGNKHITFHSPDGRIHIVYRQSYSGVNRIRHGYSVDNGDSWTYEWASPASGYAVGVYFAGCTDSSSNIHITYMSRTATNTANNIKYAMWTKSTESWDASETNITDVAYACNYPNVDCDSGDNIFLTYLKGDGSYTKPYSKLKASGTWGSEKAIDTSNNNFSSSFTLINSTNEYVFYAEDLEGWQTRTWDATAWSAAVTAVTGTTYAGTASQTSECVDSSGNIHATSMANSSNTFYSKWTTSWSARESIYNAGITGTISIMANKDNEIYSFYRQDDGTKHLYLAKYTGSWANSSLVTADPNWIVTGSRYYPLTSGATPADMPKTGSYFFYNNGTNSYFMRENLTWDVNAVGATFKPKVIMF